MKFKTTSNYNYKLSDKENYSGVVSQTVPNQALTVPQILEKFTRGTLGDIAQGYYYDEDPTFDGSDPTKRPDFDLVDADDIMEDIRTRKAEAEKRAKEKSAKPLADPVDPLKQTKLPLEPNDNVEA